MNERDKKQLIELSDRYRHTHITHAVDGGEIEVMTIYCTIHKFIIMIVII